MSRIGRQPIEIPENVQVQINRDQILVSGPKGELNLSLKPEIKVEITNNELHVKRAKETKMAKSFHGLFRTLIYNMVIGVTEGWEKILEVIGTGFNAKMIDDKLILNLGFSHSIELVPPGDVAISVFENKIKVAGVDKAKVSQVAAQIRAKRPPGIYSGKGIRYLGEVVKIRPGKVAKVIGAKVS